MGTPAISVVIPTFNRRDRLERVLAGLAEQECDHDALEVVVVSDGSTDGTNDYLESSDPPIDLIPVLQSNGGPSSARNAGVAVASAPLVLFIDDDIVPSPQLVGCHLDAHVDGGDLVVIGPMCTPPDHAMSPWIAWEQAKLGEQYDALERGEFDATARQFYTGNASVPTDLIRRFGGFDTTFRRAEDIELAYRFARTGVRFEFRSEAVGWHYAERAYSSWYDIAFDYGWSDVEICRINRDPRLMHSLVAAYRESSIVKRSAMRAALRYPAAADAIARLVGSLLERRTTEGGRPTRTLLSLVYGSHYYRGFAQSLGGNDAFRRLIKTWRIEDDAIVPLD